MAAAVSRGETTAIAHFLNLGHRENRDPSAFMDEPSSHPHKLFLLLNHNLHLLTSIFVHLLDRQSATKKYGFISYLEANTIAT